MTTHTTTYLYVFSIQQAQEWDFLPKSWPFLHDFSFQAPTSILALFGPFWPTLARWPNSGGPWSGHQWCFPTYIHHAPCKKPRPAQGDDMRSFWDTPMVQLCPILQRNYISRRNESSIPLRSTAVEPTFPNSSRAILERLTRWQRHRTRKWKSPSPRLRAKYTKLKPLFHLCCNFVTNHRSSWFACYTTRDAKIHKRYICQLEELVTR